MLGGILLVSLLWESWRLVRVANAVKLRASRSPSSRSPGREISVITSW
jgi:hypothetical protein